MAVAVGLGEADGGEVVFGAGAGAVVFEAGEVGFAAGAVVFAGAVGFDEGEAGFAADEVGGVFAGGGPTVT